MKRNLILGIATNYTGEQLQPLVESWKARASATSDLALVIHDHSHETRSYLEQAGVIVAGVAERPRHIPDVVYRKRNGVKLHIPLLMLGLLSHLPGGNARRAFQWGIGGVFHHPCQARYWQYLDFLRSQNRRQRWAKVLLCDTRDVFFQDDPFARTPDDFLFLALESNGHMVNNSPTNAGWIRTLYSQAMLDAMWEHPLICAGTTFGSMSRIVDYLKLMTDEIMRRTHRMRCFWGFDQAVHNYLWFHGHLPGSTLCRNWHGPIATISKDPIESMRFDAEGRMINHDGSVIAIVHQYDRHPALVERFTRLSSTT